MKKKLLLRPRKSPNKLSINGKRFQEKMVMLFRKKASEKNGGFKPKKSGLRKRLLRSFGILMILTAIIAIFNYFVLNNFYESDLDNYQRGTVRFQLPPLAPGPHSLRIKAWDVVNNSSVICSPTRM